ncbi:477_t:CDS:2, partial [Gigaspora rosea]
RHLQKLSFTGVVVVGAASKTESVSLGEINPKGKETYKGLL